MVLKWIYLYKIDINKNIDGMGERWDNNETKILFKLKGEEI